MTSARSFHRFFFDLPWVSFCSLSDLDSLPEPPFHLVSLVLWEPFLIFRVDFCRLTIFSRPSPSSGMCITSAFGPSLCFIMLLILCAPFKQMFLIWNILRLTKNLFLFLFKIASRNFFPYISFTMGFRMELIKTYTCYSIWAFKLALMRSQRVGI